MYTILGKQRERDLERLRERLQERDRERERLRERGRRERDKNGGRRYPGRRSIILRDPIKGKRSMLIDIFF